MATQFFSADRYHPSGNDVVDVKQALLSRLHLPVELIDTIIDHAEYWPRTVTRRGSMTIYAGETENKLLLRSFPIGYAPGQDDYQLDEEILASFPTVRTNPWPKEREPPNTSTEDVLRAWIASSQPRSEHPVRKIVFTIDSHDQGWGGEQLPGEYEGSYTWFDAGLEKFCAYPEDSVTDVDENAPWPQLRIKRNGTREVTLGNGKKVQLSDNSSLLGGLCTINPESIKIPPGASQGNDWDNGSESFSDFDQNEETEDGQAGSHNDGGLVGPPDELNPGSQAPYRPPPTEFTHTAQTGGLVGPPDDLNPGSQAPYVFPPGNTSGMQGRCGGVLIPPNWSTGENGSSSGGLVGPPDELNPGSQAPIRPRQPRPPKIKYRFEHRMLPGDDALQKNRRAERQDKTHVITWSAEDKVVPDSTEGEALQAAGRGRNTGNGDFVRNLKAGDCVTIWGKSRFGGWSNHVNSVTMEVYWAV